MSVVVVKKEATSNSSLQQLRYKTRMHAVMLQHYIRLFVVLLILYADKAS